MERNLRTRSKEKNSNGCTKPVKDSWSYVDHHDDYLFGFSWPPRSYTCSFCKREFRSAQALGGHMNVHRRDRARLRLQSPPRTSIEATHSYFMNPSPNPKFSSPLKGSSSPSPKTLIRALASSSSASPSSLSVDISEKRTKFLCETFSPKLKNLTKIDTTAKSLVTVEEFKGCGKEDGRKSLKMDESIISLEFEIGLISESKQDLDLELRLGIA